MTSSSSMISGPHRQRPHDRDPLLLAAGEPVRILPGLVGQAEPLQQLAGLRVGDGPVGAQDPGGRERHVAQHRHVREQVERLEHDADPPADGVEVRARRRDLLAAQEDPAGVDLLERVDAAQHRRLPGPRRTDQADHLVRRHVEVDPAEHLEIARRTCARPRAEPPVSVIVRRVAPTPQLAPRDQPVGEPRERDRDQDEQERGHESGSSSRTAGSCRSAPPSGASIEPSSPTSAVSFCERDEVVQQRRDHPTHACGTTTCRSAWSRVRARATAPPPPGSGGPTRCRRGTPPRRTPSTTARAPRRRRPPGSKFETPGHLQPGQAEAEQDHHQDQRHAAEEVGVQHGHQPEREEHRAGDLPDDRDHERQQQDQRLRDQEHLHVQQERRPDRGGCPCRGSSPSSRASRRSSRGRRSSRARGTSTSPSTTKKTTVLAVETRTARRPRTCATPGARAGGRGRCRGRARSRRYVELIVGTSR